MISSVPLNDGTRSPCFTMAMVNLKPSGLLSPSEMNSYVFTHSGVKLLLYLADLCYLTCSPKSDFLCLLPLQLAAMFGIMVMVWYYDVKTSQLPLFETARLHEERVQEH